MNEQGLSKSENAFFSEAKLQRKLKQVKSVLVELGYRGEECEIYTYGTVSAKIAPRLKCYKNASRLNRYNFPTDNAIDFLFSTLHTTPFHYEVLKIGSR